jgi:hypothetical protein
MSAETNRMFVSPERVVPPARVHGRNRRTRRRGLSHRGRRSLAGPKILFAQDRDRVGLLACSRAPKTATSSWNGNTPEVSATEAIHSWDTLSCAALSAIHASFRCHLGATELSSCSGSSR